jgi:hypothetical protein
MGASNHYIIGSRPELADFRWFDRPRARWDPLDDIRR